MDEGRGDQVAIIHESPVTNSMTKITYNQLLNDVILFCVLMSKYFIKKVKKTLLVANLKLI